MFKELAVTLAALQKDNPGIVQLLARPELSPSELVPRLYYFSLTSEKMGVDEAYQLTPSTATDAPNDVIELLRTYRPFATYAYDYVTDQKLNEALGGRGYRLLMACYDADFASGCPAYYLAVNQDTSGGVEKGQSQKEIVLCVRGTYSPEDVFTDLIATGCAFECLEAHSKEKKEAQHDVTDAETVAKAHAGMTKTALFLADKYGTVLQGLKDGGYRVTLVGHSLGAGVTSLFALYLKQNLGFTPDSLRCFAFEPPACMERSLSQACEDVVVSLVHADDVVPRLAVTPFYNVLEELVAFDWRAVGATSSSSGGGGVSMPTALTLMQRFAGMIPSGGSGSGNGGNENANDEVQVAETASVVASIAAGVDGGAAGGKKQSPSDGSAEKPRDETSQFNPNYDPFVPGRVVFVYSASPQQQQQDSDTHAADHGVRRKLVGADHPLLRRMRVTSTMISDHFIDKEQFLTALG